MIERIISTAIQCLIGYLFIAYIPVWLKIRGTFATILKIIGVLIILGALLSWI